MGNDGKPCSIGRRCFDGGGGPTGYPITGVRSGPDIYGQGDELEGYQRRLEAINEFVSECREASIQVAIEPVPKAALDALDDLQELVEKDPTSIDTSGNLVRSAKILEAIVEKRRESVVGAWQDHCATVIPVPQPQLLDLLQRSSSTEDAAGELDSLDPEPGVLAQSQIR